VPFKFRIAPPDGTTRVVTLGTFLLLGGLTFWIVSGGEIEALDIFILFLIWGPLAVPWLFAPRSVCSLPMRD
jgi:hypothetical protein